MKAKSVSFLNFLEKRIVYLSNCGRHGTANNYRRAKSSLLKYLKGRDLLFKEVDSAFVDLYQDWLMARGMCRNSASFHLRILRAVYNKGVRQGLVVQSYPFGEAYTGVDHTHKRCVTASVISRLGTLDLRANPQLAMARDLFLFSFYARGMSFIDIVFLRKSEVFENEIVYTRKKTHGLMRVRIEKQIREIIMRYSRERPQSEYVFPVLPCESKGERYGEYLKALGVYNYRLRKLSEMMGLKRSLTSYVSRHTWASVAYKLDIPVSVISSGMGHSSEAVTRIYLDSLENGVIDKANRKIIKSLVG